MSRRELKVLAEYKTISLSLLHGGDGDAFLVLNDAYPTKAVFMTRTEALRVIAMLSSGLLEMEEADAKE